MEQEFDQHSSNQDKTDLIEKKLLLAANPFTGVVFTAEEAELLGAFEETALPEEEADIEAMLDVDHLNESL